MVPVNFEVLTNGVDLDKAKRAVIFIHGRGATAEDILALHKHFPIHEYYCVAPRAEGNTWYPYSFLSDEADNEPQLSNSLDTLHALTQTIVNKGIQRSNIFFIGFSQGACLTLEYLARNAELYGGAIAFTGGLIGEILNKNKYKGSLNNTPIYIGTSNPDAHVPIERARESSKMLQEMGANVKYEEFDYMGHTILPEELKSASNFIFKK